MYVQLDLGESRRDVEIAVHHPDATVADLLDVLDPGGAASLEVDGRLVPARQRLDRAGIVPGVRIRPAAEDWGPALAASTAEAAGCRDRSEPAVVLRSVGGLDAGRAWPLAPGRYRLGRSSVAAPAGVVRPEVQLDDPTVSAVHAELVVGDDGAVTVTDLGSRNGTWIGSRPCGRAPDILRPGERVRCGASVLAVTAVSPTAQRPTAPVRRSGARPLHRPPRPGPPAEPEPIDAPPAPTPTSGRTPIGVVSVLVPIVLGLVMVRVLHSWTYALFMLLSPVMLVGTAVEQRRRGRKARRRDAATYKRALQELDGDLDAAQQDAVSRQWTRLPGVAEACARAADASPHLWERRPHHPDAFAVAVGLGPVPWSAPVRGDRRSWSTEVVEAVDRRSTLADVPVEIDLAPGQVVGVAGSRSALLAVTRALLVQLAALHGPADLLIAVCADEEATADWDWVKWLPHAAATTATVGRPAVALGEEAIDELVAALAAARHGSRPVARPGVGAGETEDDGDEPLLVVVIDRRDGAGGAVGPAQRLLRGGFGPVAAIVVSEDAERLPVATSTVVALEGTSGAASVHRIDPAEAVEGVHAAGVTVPVAEHAARRLAVFTDPLAPPGTDLPATVALPSLLGLDPPSALALQARWAGVGPDPAPVAVLGVAADGPVTVDLGRDGPHALVAGTTGSGKSELLRTLVASLAASSSPKHLNLVLIDFKGGSAFAECAGLPHTVGFVTDLDDHLEARALRCLEAELRHRERLLADAGVADLHEHRRQARPTDEPLPRLVVVIDEFATLASELPDFVDALVGIAQRGRSLGVHLVLATQRPAGAVSANIQANTDLRIALRVQTPEESDDVVGTPAAAALPRGARGRAIVRYGHTGVVTMQTALVSGRTPRGRRPVEVRPFSVAPTVTATADPRRWPTPTVDQCLRTQPVATPHPSGGPLPPERQAGGPGRDESDLAFFARAAHGRVRRRRRAAAAVTVALGAPPRHTPCRPRARRRRSR